MIGEGRNYRRAKATCSSRIEREPSRDRSPRLELVLVEGGPREATNHKGKVASMESSSNANSQNDWGNVQGEDPGGPEEASGQTEKGPSKGCSPSHELLGMTMVQVDRNKAEERSRKDQANEPRN